MKDAKKMMDNKEIMQEYKTLLLDPITDELRNAAMDAVDPSEKIHLESVAEQLNSAWDSSVNSFLVQESYNTSTYLPLATLDFPALIKQYIRLCRMKLRYLTRILKKASSLLSGDLSVVWL